jgi:predicted RNA-binding Zn-ribbon protein involved in translation (DUF1610 family)
MSWEVMSRTKFTCPCGKGEYEVISEMDDWNRTRDSAEMLCPNCKDKYIWREVNPSNRPAREYSTWVKKENVNFKD